MFVYLFISRPLQSQNDGHSVSEKDFTMDTFLQKGNIFSVEVRGASELSAVICKGENEERYLYLCLTKVLF